jgi:uncharacterized protein
MKTKSTRRDFLTASLGLPAAGLAVSTRDIAGPPSELPLLQSPGTPQGVRYGVLGRTGLKVSRLILCPLVASDTAVIEKAVDMGINCFITAREYQNGNNERMLAAGPKGNRQKVVLGTKTVD